METQGKAGSPPAPFVHAIAGFQDGHRLQVRAVESSSMKAFQSPADQDVAVSSVIDWFGTSFQENPGRPPAGLTGKPPVASTGRSGR
jgi:hypothetical protein